MTADNDNAKALLALQAKWLADQDSIVVKQWEQVRAYINVVIFAGYAGAFAVWNFVHDKMPSKLTALVALSLIVSIAAFSLYEVFKAYRFSVLWQQHWSARKGRVSHQEAIDAIHQLSDKNEKLDRDVLYPIWLFAFTVTLLSALVGLGLLVYVLVAHLAGLPIA